MEKVTKGETVEETKKSKEVEDIEQNRKALKENHDFAAPITVAFTHFIDNTLDVVRSHPITFIADSSAKNNVISSSFMDKNYPSQEIFENQIKGNEEEIPVIEQTDLNRKNDTTEILHSDPRLAGVADTDPRSHEIILERVSPLYATESIHTGSYDNYDAEDIDTYFECLEDSKSWDESDICALLNDSEIHEVVLELVAKVVERATYQGNVSDYTDADREVKEITEVLEIFDTIDESFALVSDNSDTVKSESKERFGSNCDFEKIVTTSDSENCDLDFDSNELALSRYQNDVSAGSDDLAHWDYYSWQTSRRWAAATVKILLSALIEYVFSILTYLNYDSLFCAVLSCPALL